MKARLPEKAAKGEDAQREAKRKQKQIATREFCQLPNYRHALIFFYYLFF